MVVSRNTSFIQFKKNKGQDSSLLILTINIFSFKSLKINFCSILGTKHESSPWCVLGVELPNCTQVALTLDHLASRPNDAYQATNLHYINDKFKLRRWVVGVSPFSMHHTGKNIAEYLNKLIEGNKALNSVQR